jgi:signal transduction histidine kinase
MESSARYAFADAVRVQQVLLNILRNAIKFTPDGGTITVRSFDVVPAPLSGSTGSTANRTQLKLSAASPSKHGLVGISISDTGVGIASEMMSQLFRAFEQDYRLRSSELGGLGLGLFISKGTLLSSL